MIAVSDLVKQYGAFTAVDRVNISVAPGEIHGFLGPNGAGKTTTLRMIAGLLKPTAGRVIVNGHDLAADPEAAKASFGFIPDRPFIYEKLTAGEFLRFHGGLYGLNGNGVTTRVHEMLDLFELRKWENELVESFSHGMKQRLVMSAAFLHRPRAVAVDEPMVGLDPRGARLIKDVFRRMAENGVALLMSTHTLEVAQEVCHRLSIINKGRIVASGTVDEVRGARRRRGRSPDVGVPEADRRQRAAGNRRSLMQARAFPFLLVPHVLASKNRARRSDRSDYARLVIFGGIGVAVFGALFTGAALADRAAPVLRGVRRLPAAARPVVAVRELPGVPGLQRRRDLALDVLSRRRSPPAAGVAGRGAPAVPGAVHADRGAGLVDGRRVPDAGAARRRRGARRAVALLR